MAQQPDHYRVLGVSPNAEDVVIRGAYKALMLKYHPDTFKGDPQEAERKAKEINLAYEVLGDPARRAEYDAELARASGRTERPRNDSSQARPNPGGSDRSYAPPTSPPTRPSRVRIGLRNDILKVLGLIVVGWIVIRAIAGGPDATQSQSPPQAAPRAETPAPAPQQAPAQPQAVPEVQPSNPAPPAEASPVMDEDAGLDTARIFRPQDSFTVAGSADQTLWHNPLHHYLATDGAGQVSVTNELPVTEIYQDFPANATVWYHVQGGWLQGRTDELACSNCVEVRPVTRSDRDALAEDTYLLRMTARPLVAPGTRPIEFQPGAARMQDTCNMVTNPYTVNRVNRASQTPWVGYFMRDGKDQNLMSDTPVVQAGDTVTLENWVLSPGNTLWVAATASDGQRGWISTLCLASNTQ